VNISETDPVWAQGAGAQFSKFRVDQGGTSAASAVLRKMLGIGDSIKAGVAALPYNEPPKPVSTADNCVSETNWFHTAAGLLNMEPWHNGFGASGITRPGSGGVPRAELNLYNYMQGVPKTLTDNYTLIDIDHGTNDKGLNTDPVEFKETYRVLVNRIKADCPSAKIILKRPFNGAYENEIQALASETGTHYLDTTGWNVTFSADGVHPSVVGGTPAGVRYAEWIRKTFPELF
jgi:hypothetical protein